MEIGERLREAREEKEISLDRLQETTKIQKRYLLAIEQGDFQILPGKFYARAFIKEYAIAVGLEPNELLEGHKEEVPSTEVKNDVQYTRIQRSRRDRSTKPPTNFSFIPTIIVVLLVIGIFFVAWSLYQKAVTNDTDPVDQPGDNEIIRNTEENSNNSSVPDDDTDDSGQKEDDGDVSDPDPDSDSEPGEPEFSLVEENGNESTYAISNVGNDIQLSLASSGNTWLTVESGNGESLYRGEFSEDQSPIEFDVSNEDQIFLSIGYAPDLQITINGVDLEYAIDPNKEVVQKIWITMNDSTE